MLLAQIMRLVMQSTEEGIFGLDHAGNHTFVNPAAARMLGYEVSELIGRHSHSVWHHTRPNGTNYPAEGCPIYQAMLKGVACHGEEYFIRKDGTGLKVEFSSMPVRKKSGEIASGVVIFRDITERKHAEVALKIAKQYLDIIINATGDPIFIKDHNSRFVSVNDAFCNMLGIGRENIIGKTLGESLPKDQMDHFLEIDKLVLESGQENLCEEFLTGHDGKTLTIVTRKTRYIDEQGNAFISGVIRDITDRKQMEKIFLEAERWSAIGEMSSVVVHDFGNSLAIISGNMQVASSVPDVPPKVAGYIQATQNCVSALAARIEQLRNFTRKVSKVGFMAMDLNKMLDEIIMRTQPIWKDDPEKKGLQISFQKIFGEIRSVDGVPEWLDDVFNNLIQNAVEAMPKGGTITLETGIIEQKVYVRITDTGMGMDEETREKIFHLNFTTKGFGSGRGLGMSNARFILLHHGGSIAVKKTAPGEGTTLEILFPFGTKETRRLSE